MTTLIRGEPPISAAYRFAVETELQRFAKDNGCVVSDSVWKIESSKGIVVFTLTMEDGRQAVLAAPWHKQGKGG